MEDKREGVVGEGEGYGGREGGRGREMEDEGVRVCGCRERVGEQGREIESVQARERESTRSQKREREHVCVVCLCDMERACVRVPDRHCVCVCVCVCVCLCICAQSKELASTLERVQADEQRLVHIHLKHQAAQLAILRDSLQVLF
jgi:hypothetical protein